MTLTQIHPLRFTQEEIIEKARCQYMKFDHSGHYTLSVIVDFEDELQLIYTYVVSFKRQSFDELWEVVDITEVTLLN